MTRVAHDNRRIQRRIALETPITLLDIHGDAHSMMTHDISMAGMFVHTDDGNRFKLRDMVHVQIELPDTEEIVYLLARVIRVILPSDANGSQHVPGLGLAFHGLDQARRQQWESFVQRMSAEYERLFAGVPTPTSASRPAPPSTSAQRTAEYIVHFRDVFDLASVLTWDFVCGAMFLETQATSPKGSPVRLLLVHPMDHTVFPIPGTVARIHPRGMSIEFDRMTPQHIKLFKEFAELGLPELDSAHVCEGGWLICDDDDPSNDELIDAA